MLVGFTTNNGGALSIQYDFSVKFQLAPSLTIGGTTVYTNTDPGFDAILADGGGFFVLNNNTQVSVQLISFDPGASVKVRSTVLDTLNEAAVLGTYTTAAPDGLHHHPTWTLSLPNGVFGDYDLVFRLTTTSGSFTASQSYAVVLTNVTPAPTATPTSTGTPTATVSPTPTPSTTSTPTLTAPGPTATPTPVPTASPTATPTAAPLCAATPLAGCRVPVVAVKSSLRIGNKSNDAKDTLQWKLAKGPITTKAEFGDPLGTTRYAFCVYDATGALSASAEIPAGGLCATKPCWKAAKTSFTYADKELTPDGMHQLQLKAGLKAGKTSVTLKGKGSNLDLPPMPLPAALLPLTAQLQGSNGICFATVLGVTSHNTESKLDAKD